MESFSLFCIHRREQWLGRYFIFAVLAVMLAGGALVIAQQQIDISGVWQSNVGLTYHISQSGNDFTWRVDGRSQTGSGNLHGLELSASWLEGNNRGAARGVIVLDQNRRAGRIEWSNGVVFLRSAGTPPPQRPTEMPPGREPETLDISGIWRSNTGKEYQIDQSGNRFNWIDVRSGERAEGFIEGDRTRSTWPGPNGPLSAEGRIAVGVQPGWAVRIEWSNRVVFTRGEHAEPGGPPPTRDPLHPGEELPAPPEGIDIGGIWFGNNGLTYEFAQHGRRFDWQAADGSKGNGALAKEMSVTSSFPDKRSVPGRVYMGREPGLAAVIEWENGLVLTREAPPEMERSGPEGPPRPERQVNPEMIPLEQARSIPAETVVIAHLQKTKVYNAWVKMGGPLGGLGYDVRYSANTPAGSKIIYVTDNYSGVNISRDGGATWVASNNGINARSGTSRDAIPVFSLTVDPNNPKTVWAGLKDVSGAYKSTDGGATWSDVSPERGGNFVYRGFTIMPGNSNLVFAAGEVPMNVQGKEFDKTRGRVYKTEDGGQSWKIIWQGENLARYVILHPGNPNIIYISTGIFDREANNSDCTNSILNTNNLAGSYTARGGLGVMKSEDGGQTWVALGRDKGLTDLYVGSLVMHPKNANILLAGCGNNSASYYKENGQQVALGGVFLTMNGGESWLKTLGGETITAVDFAWSDPKIAYAGSRTHFYRSEDGGKSWALVNGSYSQPWGPPGVASGFPIDILVDPKKPNVLFVNNYGGGNVKSVDGGKNWTVASMGYTGALMFDVGIDAKNPDIVYAGGRSGAFRSLDGGLNWQGLSFPPAQFMECYSVALHPSNPKLVLASREQMGALYRSQDGGLSWVKMYQLPVTPGDPKKDFGFKRIVYAPSNSKIIYAGSSRPSNTLEMIIKTGGLGVFKSTDGGLTWAEANTRRTRNWSINNLAVHPQNPNTVYAATVSDGLHKTTDGGSNWVRLNGLNAADVRAVAIRPDKPDQVYAGVNDGGVYFSANGGTTWTAMASGMEPNDAIFSLVVDPAQPANVWAGSNKTGVYRYDTIEQHWVHFNTGLRTRAVTDLAISASGKVLYATTWGEGVFRLELKPAGSQ